MVLCNEPSGASASLEPTVLTNKQVGRRCCCFWSVLMTQSKDGYVQIEEMMSSFPKHLYTENNRGVFSDVSVCLWCVLAFSDLIFHLSLKGKYQFSKIPVCMQTGSKSDAICPRLFHTVAVDDFHLLKLWFWFKLRWLHVLVVKLCVSVDVF